MADTADLLRRYYSNPALHPSADEVPMLPPLPDRRPSLRNPAPRVQDPLQPAYEGAATGINPQVIGYGLGQTVGHGWDALRNGRYSDATLSALELLAGMAPIPGAKVKGKAHERGTRAGEGAGAGAEAGRVSDRGGMEGGRGQLPPPGGAYDPYATPTNQPRTVKIPGHGEVEARPIPQIQEAKRDYMASKGDEKEKPDG